MAKLSQLDKAIAAIEGEKAVLEHAIAKLRQQQGTPTPRTRKKPLPVLAAGERPPVRQRGLSDERPDNS